MAPTTFGDSVWSIVVIGGPIVLIAALIFAMTRNRVSRRQHERSEEATRQLYKDGAVDESSRS